MASAATFAASFTHSSIQWASQAWGSPCPQIQKLQLATLAVGYNKALRKWVPFLNPKDECRSL